MLRARIAHAAASTSTSSRVAAASARLESLLGRVGDGDDVAAAVAVATDGTDRLADLQVRVRLNDALGREHGIEAADARDAARRQRARLAR